MFKSDIKSSIRIVINKKNNSEYVTTIVKYMARLPSVSHLVFNQSFYVSYNQQEFKISNDIYGKFMIVDDNIRVLDIITSTLTNTQLRQFLDSIYINYVSSDKRQYLYNARSSNYSKIRFDKTLFDTEITFNHIFNKEIEYAKRHIRFFINNKKWYEQNGFPYTLGVIVHGPSGCGKSSFIKAIANECGRQVIMVPLDRKTKIKQLESLFFNEEINVYNSNTKNITNKYIPFHNRMYVIENIDRISHKQFSEVKELLYGLLESRERLVVFTAEQIKLVDKSLLSAGRIDTQVYLDYCNVDTIMDMVINFYETDIKDYDDFKKSLCDNVLTPSDVYEILFRNITNHDSALKELTDKCNVDIVEKVIENDLQEDVDSIISQELEEEKEVESKSNFLFDSVSSSEMTTLEVSSSEMTTLEVSSSEMTTLEVSSSEMTHLEVSSSEMTTLGVSSEDNEQKKEFVKDVKDIELVDFKIPKIEVKKEELVDYELSDSDFSDNINDTGETGLTQSQFLKGISVISSMSDKVHKKSVIVDNFFDIKK
jgi:hypothetical protein